VAASQRLGSKQLVISEPADDDNELPDEDGGEVFTSNI
jgi:hypothetical protein